MNERIKELVEQATIRGVEYRPGDDGHPTPTFYFDKEKFAELIVKECCQFENSYSGDAGLVARSFSRKIKQHFGVEE